MDPWDPNNPEEKDVLSKELLELIENIEPDLIQRVTMDILIAHLPKYNVLDPLTKQKIQAEKVGFQQVEILVEHLKRGCRYQLHGFLKSLKESHQAGALHLCEALRKELDNNAKRSGSLPISQTRSGQVSNAEQHLVDSSIPEFTLLNNDKLKIVDEFLTEHKPMILRELKYTKELAAQLEACHVLDKQAVSRIAAKSTLGNAEQVSEVLDHTRTIGHLRGFLQAVKNDGRKFILENMELNTSTIWWTKRD